MRAAWVARHFSLGRSRWSLEGGTNSGEIPHRFSPGYEELPSALKKLGLDLQPVSVPVIFYAIESAHEPTAN
jgi:hypothetical protein